MSPETRSVRALQQYRPKGGVEFVFDPVTRTFALGRPARWVGIEGSPHEKLAKAIGADPSVVVGGTVTRSREGGKFETTEQSGHYWQNWNDDVRRQFMDMMNAYGLELGTPHL